MSTGFHSQNGLKLGTFTSQLPTVMGHSGQLREAIVNLIQNAVDAMDSVADDP
jgi:signal transduction histidine kinase